MLAPLASDTFNAEGVTAHLEVPTNGDNVSVYAGEVPVQIVYDAASESYRLTVGNRAQTFRPQDIDAAQSSDAVTTYVRTDGSTTDSLSLTKTGTGPGQTQYVGGAFWQRQVNGSATIVGDFDAATYGIETELSDVPTSGSASYDVTLLGARNQSTLIYALSGEGRINLDFTTDALNGEGWYRETETESGFTANDTRWTLLATLTTDAEIVGYIDLDGVARLSGGLFGPDASEIGATFFSNPNSESSTVGLLLGARGDYPVNTATNLNTPSADTFYAPISGGLRIFDDIDGNIVDAVEELGTIDSVLTTEDTGVVVYGDGGPINLALIGGGETSQQEYRLTFEYMRVFDRLQQINSFGIFYDNFAFGFRTSPDDLPLTGTAIYDMFVRGALSENGFDGPKAVLGDGSLELDFATGAVSGAGDYSVYDSLPAQFELYATPGSDVLQTGVWSLTGGVAASQEFLTGTLFFDGARLYTGNWSGFLFGPKAEEVSISGALFGTQSEMSVNLFGKLDDAQTASLRTLAELPAGTAVSYLSQGAGWRYDATLDRNYDDTLIPNLNGDVYYDASATPPGVVLDGLYSTQNTTFSAALSTDEVNVYTGAPTDLTADIDEFEVRDYVFDGQGGRVELTYSGFAEIQGRGSINSEGGTYNVSLYVPYGNQTAADRVPTGSASYTAAHVGGRGEVWGDDGPEYYDLTGSSTLTANFDAGTITALLALQGEHLDNSASLDFGDFAFEGTTLVNSGGLGFSAQSTDDATGGMSGLFFGANAEEFGATFDIEATRGGTYFELYGATVGKQD